MGNRVKDAIRRSGRTYEDIGEQIGVSAQAISEIANGRTKRATARFALAAALGVNVSDLWPEPEPDATAAAA
jgi:transcriptional regulator with XRE-family HTH domain